MDFRSKSAKIAHWISVPMYVIFACISFFCVLRGLILANEGNNGVPWAVGFLVCILVAAGFGVVAAGTTRD